MNLRSVACALLVVATATGCGVTTGSTGVNTISHKQADSLATQDDKGLNALTEAGYTALAVGTTSDNRPVLLLRVCGKKSPSLDHCLRNVDPGVETPDVYLGVKDASAKRLTLTGTYDLLYMSPVGHHPDNGLRCQPDPIDTKFTPETVSSFKKLGQQSRKLNYRNYQGGSPTQTLQIDQGWWECSTTFGHRP